MKKVVSIVMTVLALSLAGPEMAAGQQPDSAAIEEQLERYEARFNAGDAEGISNLFREDVVYYDALGGIHEGRDAVRRMYRENLAAGFRDMSVEAVEIEVYGDTAYDIARYMITAPDGERIEGRHLAILTKVDGEWKVERTLVNAKVPE